MSEKIGATKNREKERYTIESSVKKSMTKMNGKIKI